MGKYPIDVAHFLEELRSIAQLGLNYTRDPYDKARYERLLELAAGEYAKLSGLPADTIIGRFRDELGHVTPKIGVDSAVFDQHGRLLLIKRHDDFLWSLPCGWVEVNETPQEAIKRELFEETGLTVKVGSLIDLFVRLPGTYGQPHTSCHAMYHCIPIGGEAGVSEEALEVGYFDTKTINVWHKDHQMRAEVACKFWRDRICDKQAPDAGAV